MCKLAIFHSQSVEYVCIMKPTGLHADGELKWNAITPLNLFIPSNSLKIVFKTVG